MAAIHDLFCTDSTGVMAYARQQTQQLGRRELSLLLITALQQHAGLDWFETGDVFDRVAQMRPTPPQTNATRADNLSAKNAPAAGLPVRADNPLFAQADRSHTPPHGWPHSSRPARNSAKRPPQDSSAAAYEQCSRTSSSSAGTASACPPKPKASSRMRRKPAVLPRS